MEVKNRKPLDRKAGWFFLCEALRSAAVELPLFKAAIESPQSKASRIFGMLVNDFVDKFSVRKNQRWYNRGHLFSGV